MMHSVSSKHLIRVGKDIYFITIKYVTPTGDIKSKKFKCSYEELSSLVESLNVAYNSVSKACDSNEMISK